MNGHQTKTQTDTPLARTSPSGDRLHCALSSSASLCARRERQWRCSHSVIMMSRGDMNALIVSICPPFLFFWRQINSHSYITHLIWCVRAIVVIIIIIIIIGTNEPALAPISAPHPAGLESSLTSSS